MYVTLRIWSVNIYLARELFCFFSCRQKKSHRGEWEKISKREKRERGFFLFFSLPSFVFLHLLLPLFSSSPKERERESYTRTRRRAKREERERESTRSFLLLSFFFFLFLLRWRERAKSFYSIISFVEEREVWVTTPPIEFQRARGKHTYKWAAASLSRLLNTAH